jgi:NDP-sugar pyrophosphorylase family protein
MIRSAILLAAGRGQRQRPYTDDTPKPLLPVNGRATLDFVLCAAARAGIARVCIVTNHLEEQIFHFAGDGSRWNLAVTFAHQAHLRGNGDALLSVPRTWLQEEPVMVVATDYILDENALFELANAHETHGTDITMSLKACPIHEPKREEIMSPYAASILFVCPPALWDYLPRIEPSARGEIEMQSALQMMIEDGWQACGVLQAAPREWSAELMNA